MIVSRFVSSVCLCVCVCMFVLRLRSPVSLDYMCNTHGYMVKERDSTICSLLYTDRGVCVYVSFSRYVSLFALYCCADHSYTIGKIVYTCDSTYSWSHRAFWLALYFLWKIAFKPKILRKHLNRRIEILLNWRQMQHFWKIVHDFIHNHRSHSIVAIRSENYHPKLNLWIHESALSVRSARMIRHQHLLFWWFASHYMMVNVYSCPDLSGKLHTLTRCAHTGEQSMCATYIDRFECAGLQMFLRCSRKETTKKEGEITAWVVASVYVHRDINETKYRKKRINKRNHINFAQDSVCEMIRQCSSRSCDVSF